MMVCHQVSSDTADKVAGILSGYSSASKPAGPCLLDGDFLLESTLRGIPENNAKVVATAVPSSTQDVPHVHEHVALPIALVADLSSRKVSVTSSQQSACYVDLLAGCNSAFSNSEWDYEERPLTQVSLKGSSDQEREEYKAAKCRKCPNFGACAC